MKELELIVTECYGIVDRMILEWSEAETENDQLELVYKAHELVPNEPPYDPEELETETAFRYYLFKFQQDAWKIVNRQQVIMEKFRVPELSEAAKRELRVVRSWKKIQSVWSEYLDAKEAGDQIEERRLESVVRVLCKSHPQHFFWDEVNKTPVVVTGVEEHVDEIESFTQMVQKTQRTTNTEMAKERKRREQDLFRAAGGKVIIRPQKKVKRKARGGRVVEVIQKAHAIWRQPEGSFLLWRKDVPRLEYWDQKTKEIKELVWTQELRGANHISAAEAMANHGDRQGEVS